VNVGIRPIRPIRLICPIPQPLIGVVATGPQYTAQDEFVVNEFDVSSASA
jgi:hypothetical protein